MTTCPHPEGRFYIAENPETGKDLCTALFLQHPHERRTAILNSIAVWDENNRQQGLGKTVIVVAINELKTLGFNRILVDEVYFSAAGFYRALGFTEIYRGIESNGVRFEFEVYI